MKVLVFSDIHGSSYYAEKIKEITDIEKPDKIILLGDLYYHGPRNDLTKEYSPMKVSEILNSLKDKILAVKGNCDAEVDQKISEFKLEDHLLLDINNIKIYFTHGHKYNIEVIPYEDFEILIYGHIHQGFIQEKEGYIFANPGSISLPRAGTEHSYLVLENEKLILKNVNGNVLQEIIYMKESKQYIGKSVKVKIDRALGTKHPKHGFEYEVNYGFIPNTISGDGEELDAYILGIDYPVEEYEGKCIAVIHRINDDDDKLIVVPEGLDFSDEEIRRLTNFQEKYFESEIIR